MERGADDCDPGDTNNNGSDSRQTQRSRPGCYQFFGIKSHLHHFYEYEDKSAGDDESTNYLLQPKKSKRCSPILWKILLWFGINSLVFGAVLILVSHFMPRHSILHSDSEDGRFAVVDSKAASKNTLLDILGTVGIISFCLAGVLIIIAVLLPTYFNDYCFEDRAVRRTSSLGEMSGYSSLPSNEPSSPIERTVPVTQLILGVQPKRKESESSIDSHYRAID